MIKLTVKKQPPTTMNVIEQSVRMSATEAVQVGVQLEIDNKTLIFDDGVLRVNTADAVEQDNTLPITSAAVYTTVGNIGAILDTI